MTKHTHAFISISETKEKCALCDQYRKKKIEEKPDYCNCIDGTFSGKEDYLPSICLACERKLIVGEHVYHSVCGFTLHGSICEKCHDKRDDCEESEY